MKSGRFRFTKMNIILEVQALQDWGGVIVSARFTYGWLSKLWSLFGSLLLNPKP